MGPIYGRGSREQLADAYTYSLRCAADLGASSIVFPLLSAGAYGWPIPDAARCALECLATAETEFDEISLVVFSSELARIVREQAEGIGMAFAT